MERSESAMHGYVGCFLDASKKKSQEVHAHLARIFLQGDDTKSQLL